MTESSRLIIVLGSGPGIGVHVAAHFASHTFDKVALISRNAERLNEDSESVRKAVEAAKASSNITSYSLEISTYATDLAVTSQIEETLNKIVKTLGKPEVVLYNAAMLVKSGLFEYSEADLELGWKVVIPGELSSLSNFVSEY
jgi:NAD(P)-dependent dehydrogenase (short-subunit alcohol dehydrogenase family)